MRTLCTPVVSKTVLVGLLAALSVRAEERDIEKLEPARIPRIQAPAKIAFDQKPIRVKVLVLVFDPWVPPEVYAAGDRDARPISVRQLGKWNDPLALAQGYMEDILTASGGIVQFEIVEWNTVRRFQKKKDSFTYTPQEYFDAFSNKSKWHDPDGLDYPAMIAEFDLARRIDAGDFDELWMFGAPYFGYFESAMAGPGAFYINGGVFEQVSCRRRFAIMGFNYERGVAEMTHDLCHRTESTMSRIYGGWKVEQLTSNWAKFAANAKQSGGEAACGTCHYPPNAEKDYDYANPREVQSSADDWLNYPKLTGAKKTVTCETWGGPDYHRNYMRWWFTHLPKAPGANADGRLNNWWEYVFNYDSYDERGRRAPSPDAAPQAP
jgi:hypothetical protein